MSFPQRPGVFIGSEDFRVEVCTGSEMPAESLDALAPVIPAPMRGRNNVWLCARDRLAKRRPVVRAKDRQRER